MGRKRDAQKLLRQKVVFDPVKNILVVFREPKFEATNDRAFEIQNIKFKLDLQDLEEILLENGSQIISQTPPTNEWTPAFTGRVVWKTKAPSVHWKIPTKANTKQQTSLTIRPAPVCGICHADDHPSLFCQWKAKYPKLGTTRKSYSAR